MGVEDNIIRLYESNFKDNPIYNSRIIHLNHAGGTSKINHDELEYNKKFMNILNTIFRKIT